MGIAIDYAFDKPTIATLQAHNVVAVGRYVGPQSWGKTITSAEAESLLAAGIVFWLVFEIGSTDAQGGVAAGTANAKTALANLPAGVDPTKVVIYFAVDQSISPEAAIPYFQGINAVLPYTQTGVYGEGALCTLLKTDGLAAFFWQSESTSFPGNATTLPISHIQQKTSGSPIPGTDYDVLLQGDIGQWPRPAAPAPTPPTPTPAPTPTPPPAPTPTPGVEVIPTSIKIVTDANGWVPSPVPISKVVNVVVVTLDPQALGGYANVPVFQGVASSTAADSPNGVLVFDGTSDGTYGATVWSTP